MDLFIPIVLVLVGVGLIVAEVYLVPGFNVIGILGVLTMVFAVGYAFSEAGTASGVATAAGALGLSGGVFWAMWRSGAWERFVLAANLRADDALVQRESEDRARYLGRVGVATTPLRPTGVAEVDGARIEVVTEGDFIAAGSRIRVVAMDRRRYFVRLAGEVPATTAP